MEPLKPTGPDGILNPRESQAKFRLSRYAPAEDLRPFVLRYWIVEWDLRGQPPHLQELVPQPCVNLVFEKGDSRIYGVSTARFSRLLADRGRVLGVKFRPGGFFPFLRKPVATLTDRSMPARELFGPEAEALEATILSQTDASEMVRLAEDFLCRRLPEPDENVETVSRIVDAIVADREITRVADLAERVGLSERTLQRLFHRYVGVSPKWVIRRYRLLEATQRVAGAVESWPRIALDLGYFDQAHFINDFRSVVGMPPTEYARRIGPAS